MKRTIPLGSGNVVLDHDVNWKVVNKVRRMEAEETMYKTNTAVFVLTDHLRHMHSRTIFFTWPPRRLTPSEMQTLANGHDEFKHYDEREHDVSEFIPNIPLNAWAYNEKGPRLREHMYLQGVDFARIRKQVFQDATKESYFKFFQHVYDQSGSRIIWDVFLLLPKRPMATMSRVPFINDSRLLELRRCVNGGPCDNVSTVPDEAFTVPCSFFGHMDEHGNWNRPSETVCDVDGNWKTSSGYWVKIDGSNDSRTAVLNVLHALLSSARKELVLEWSKPRPSRIFKLLEVFAAKTKHLNVRLSIRFPYMGDAQHGIAESRKVQSHLDALVGVLHKALPNAPTIFSVIDVHLQPEQNMIGEYGEDVVPHHAAEHTRILITRTFQKVPLHFTISSDGGYMRMRFKESII